jgi:hypothetical protein
MIDHVIDHVIFAAADCQKKFAKFFTQAKKARGDRVRLSREHVGWGPPAFPGLTSLGGLVHGNYPPAKRIVDTKP